MDDAELRELFRSECEEHLQTLDDGLLRLETSPHDNAALERVFRAAHSLKGTSRMLNFSEVEGIAHHLEDQLGDAKRGSLLLTSGIIDRLYVGVDAIRALVQEIVSSRA